MIKASETEYSQLFDQLVVDILAGQIVAGTSPKQPRVEMICSGIEESGVSDVF